MKLNVVDLFCGCGGFSLGAELAGFHAIASVDVDETLSSSYSLNFPHSKIINADLSLVEKDFWNLHIQGQKVEGVIGGPPCQGYSRIGKSDKTDPRRSLLIHFARNVNIINPNFFVLENVEGLLDKKNEDELNATLSILESRYSIIGPMLLNAKDFGVPTNRSRVIIVGYKKYLFNNIDRNDFSPDVVSGANVQDAIRDLPEPLIKYKTNDKRDFSWSTYSKDKYEDSIYATQMKMLPPSHLGWSVSIKNLNEGKLSGFLNTQHSIDVANRYEAVVPGKIDKVSRSKKLDWLGLAPTLRAGTGSDKGSYQAVRPLHPEKGRVITVREAARLQGFPDWFVFHHTKWHSFRMIGNSVSPIVSKFILGVVKSKIKNKPKRSSAA